jgi:DNA-3-methyladenine glycosylase I
MTACAQPHIEASLPRCSWAKNPLAVAYHDTEWGIPVYDDQKHFEFLLLESAQAGLSWDTVLRKREHYREAFYGFDPRRVAQMTADDVDRLMQNPGLIRNRLKLQAAIHNAGLFLALQQDFGSFNHYIWGFVQHQTRHNAWTCLSEVPATTPASDALAKSLKKRGFKFVGSTTLYAHMQAAGLVNDHLVTCFRHPTLANPT